MKKLFFYILIIILSPTNLLTARDTTSHVFFQEVNKLSTEEIVKLGDSYGKHPDTAIVLYSITNKRYNSDMDEREKLLCAESFLKTGNIYFIQGNYNSSFEAYLQGLKICEGCTDKSLLPVLYICLGNIYCTFLDYETGIGYYIKGYSLCKDYPNDDYEYKLLANITGAYNYLNNTDQAKEYYHLSVELTQPKDTVRNYMNLLNKGLILVNEKKYSEAIKTLSESAEYAKRYQMEARYECSSYEELYKVYELIDNNDSTLYYLGLCNHLAAQYGLADILIRNLKAYSCVYESMQNMPKALYYKDKYLSFSDSILNIREFNRVKNMQSIYEMEKTNQEISFLNADKEQKEQRIKTQRKVLWSFLIGLFGVSVFLVIIYYQKKKLSQAYLNLFNINREITQSNNHYKEQRLQFEEKISNIQKELDELSSREGKTILAEEPDGFSMSDLSSSKYQTSNLNDSQKHALLESITHIMELTQEYCKEDFSLEKLASLVNSNSKYVSQIINETYHKNFNIYVNEYRVQEARVRLMDTEHYGHYTIKAIAESIGYKSTTTFVNAFRNITGITPSVFQKMAKSHESSKL